jgi:hypothetical protein
LLVFDGTNVYGFGRKPEFMCQSSVLEYHLFAASVEINNEAIAGLSEAERRMNATSEYRGGHAADWKLRKGFPLEDRTAVNFEWLIDDPALHVHAMVLAGETLFLAGPPDVLDEEDAYFRLDDSVIKGGFSEQVASLGGKKGATLMAVSASDGVELGQYQLQAPPVFDGMASADGRLFMALKDGHVVCMGE